MHRCACCCSRVGTPFTASQYSKQNVWNTHLTKKKVALLLSVLLPNIGHRMHRPHHTGKNRALTVSHTLTSRR